MKIPTISKAQILAALTFVATEAVNYGLLSGKTEQLVVGIAGIVLPGILMIADAVIHHAWAKIKIAELDAEVRKLMAYLDHNMAPPGKQDPPPTGDATGG